MAPDPIKLNTLDYLRFVEDSPSSFHAARLVTDRLVEAGFTEHPEDGPWSTEPGGHVMVRDGAAMAWWIPTGGTTDDTAFRIVGAHTDSPWFVLKPNPNATTPDGWQQIGVEVYGGMLWNSWLDRELSVAGRVLTADGSEHLVRTGAVARIPQLAIHLDRGVNDGLKLNPQTHLHPVWTVDEPDADILALVTRDAGIEAEHGEVVAADLNLIPSQAPGTFGSDGQFIAAGRQDNLSSVHSGLTAMERMAKGGKLDSSGDILVFACFNHEEIGSATNVGAAGPILQEVLERTATGLGWDAERLARAYANSTCVSSDAGHSVHPNYPEMHDPDTRPVMGRGPMLKINAKQRYATNARGAALWSRSLKAAGVDGQEFVSRNDVPCGSTIGPITATRLGILTVDVGIGLLSMHSAREMSHEADLAGISKVLEAYWLGA